MIEIYFISVEKENRLFIKRKNKLYLYSTKSQNYGDGLFGLGFPKRSSNS
jgi:hypothetical protein